MTSIPTIERADWRLGVVLTAAMTGATSSEWFAGMLPIGNNYNGDVRLHNGCWRIRNGLINDFHLRLRAGVVTLVRNEV